MGVLIKIDGVTFNEKYIIDKVDVPEDEPVVPVTIADYPVQDTLKGLYDLGGTAEATLVNHAPEPHTNTQDEALDGDYTVADGYVTFAAGSASKNRMRTYVPTSLTAETITIVALFSVPSGGSYGNRVIIGNRGSSTAANNLGISLLNDCVRFGNNGVIAERKYNNPINSNNFAILALTMDANHLRVVRYSNGALTTMAEFEGAIEAWENRMFILGGDSTGNQYDTAHISLAAMHTGAMTDEQLTEICEFVKTYGEQKGLTIE